MATIRTRQRSDGSVAFLAEIRIKQDGAIVHRESRTFDRRALAKAWADSREKALVKTEPSINGSRAVTSTTLRDLLKKYREEISEIRPLGRSKASSIRFLEKCDISRMDVRELKSSDLIAHIWARRQAGAGPSTANNDLVWLRVILRYARAAWNLPINLSVIEDAGEVLRAEKMIAKARRRTRRPTADELDALTEYFHQKERRRSSIPMSDIMWFAIHSARRQGEIVDLLFSDNDAESQTGIVRNIKHPTDRGLFRCFKYTPEAWDIVCRQRHDKRRIFPFEPKSVGAAFRRACKMLEIHDLRFHDLRHEATSRLFEAGYSIVEVQQFTLHDSWGTLSRYTHLRPETLKIR
ncbi:MAG: tyrosine-type recombinase/integrase [Gammaproteobacteria bacterium]|nr:tyrosine-type recombinase/integrase [Gammaproteobacteria bacterium]MDH3416148.1 tyrosine-type recombinase/integrase [Gammaproteobacteria bacterium]